MLARDHCITDKCEKATEYVFSDVLMNMLKNSNNKHKMNANYLVTCVYVLLYLM